MADRLLEPLPRILPPSLGRSDARVLRRLVALVALGAFFVVGIVLVTTGLSGGSDTRSAQRAPAPVTKARTPSPPAPPTTQAARAKPARTPPIAVQALSAFDPAGDGHENDDSLSLATDGNLSTAWHTEHYRTWYKPGVGIVLDAGRAVRPTALTLETDQPGFTAEVQAGSSPTGPFTRISQSSVTSDTTVYKLRAPEPERYILVWITKISDGDAADVNEIRLR